MLPKIIYCIRPYNDIALAAQVSLTAYRKNKSSRRPEQLSELNIEAFGLQAIKLGMLSACTYLCP